MTLISKMLTADPLSSSNNNRFSSTICSNLNQFQFQLHSRKSTITCARTNSNKGSFLFLRSKRSNKTLIQLARFAASNLHYVLPLPPPLDSVVREFANGGGGYGGGGGRSGGFGWGGFDGGGRKRRVNKKSKLGFWVFVIGVCFFIGFWWLNLNLNLGKVELKSEVALGVMCCLSMFLVLVRNGCVPEWVLGFCSGGFAAGLLFEKKDELRKLFGIGLKGMGVSRRRRGRRAI